VYSKTAIESTIYTLTIEGRFSCSCGTRLKYFKKMFFRTINEKGWATFLLASANGIWVYISTAA
jgi:hypothetical protein